MIDQTKEYLKKMNFIKDLTIDLYIYIAPSAAFLDT